MEGNIQTVLDTRGALRCVRFESGNVGVVTAQGKTKLVVGPFQQLSFADNGFLRVFNRRSSERRDPGSLGLSRVENEVTLPLHTRLTDEDVAYVIGNFVDCIREAIVS